MAIKSPGYLIQFDVLAVLGNILTTRDDTFTVRAYGELANREGEMCIRDSPYTYGTEHDWEEFPRRYFLHSLSGHYPFPQSGPKTCTYSLLDSQIFQSIDIEDLCIY